jgi:hypothetical protein
MTADDLEAALEDTDEVVITTTGRITGASSPPPSREPGVPAQYDQHSQVRRALIAMILPLFFVMGFHALLRQRAAVPGPARGERRHRRAGGTDRGFARRAGQGRRPGL